jgi:two-component system sensor kinase FixL
MSAEIGHELNNFLGVVAGNVALLEVHLKKQNYDQLDKYLTAVNTTLEKIRTFTANLMDLRSISSRKETVYFDRIISEVVEYLRPQKRFRGVVINTPYELESLPMLADTTQIQQLLYNLFNNAADATRDRDTRVITVRVESVRVSNSFQVAIRDTGVGFEPDKVTKAFHERFTTKPDGHGFGLVVCKRIIDHHGGKLEVESAPGEGTCITITFPMAIAETEPVPQLAAAH